MAEDNINHDQWGNQLIDAASSVNNLTYNNNDIKDEPEVIVLTSGSSNSGASDEDISNAISIGEKLGLDIDVQHLEDPRTSGPKIKRSYLDSEREGKTWTTCLNYVMDNNKKFTLKNLGMHMTARMLSRMTQDNVNKHASIQLGSVFGAFDVSASSRVGIVPEKLMDLYNQYNFKKEYFEKGTITDFYFGSKLGMNYSKDNIDEFIHKYTDQSSSLKLGEANVLNPPFQFNELDDVRSDFRRPKLGRLFCEEIYDYNLPICFFQPGIINIDTATIHFYNSYINKQTMAYQSYLRNEPTSGFKPMMNKIFGVLHTAVSWTSKQVMDLGRWYSWTPAVYRYLRMVNELLEELGMWMGLFKKEFYDEHNVGDIKENAYSDLVASVKSKGDELRSKIDDLANSIWYKYESIKARSGTHLQGGGYDSMRDGPAYAYHAQNHAQNQLRSIEQVAAEKVPVSDIAKTAIKDVKQAATTKAQRVNEVIDTYKKTASDALNSVVKRNSDNSIDVMGTAGSMLSTAGGFLKDAAQNAVAKLDLLSSTDTEEKDYLSDSIDDELVQGFDHYMANDVYPSFRLSALNVLPHYSDIKGMGQKTDSDNDSGENSEDVLSKTIPFAIDKGASSSESFSNTYQQHPLVEQYNQQYEESNSANLIGVGGDIGSTVATSMKNQLNGDVISNIVNLISSPLESASSALGGTFGNVANYVKNKVINSAIETAAENGLTGEVGMVATGAGRFVLPEVWSDSSFDKSYSMSMKLRCPYGHRLYIYENQLLPLAFIIGMTAPRAVGVQMYTNPFYIKMYCKGLFSVPLGSITSLSINHGDGENDRTTDGFFRTMSLSITVKDMLPNLAIGLQAGSTGIMKAANPGMSNYLLTLANIDFVDKAMWEQNYQNCTFNYMGYDLMEDENVDPKEVLSLSQNNGTAKVITAPLDNFAKSNSTGPYTKNKVEAY